MKRTLVKTDKNGTKYWQVECRCMKCGGTGTYRWGACINGMYQFSGVCYDCDGTGIETEIEKEYTPEHKAKLDAQRAKREAKRQAELDAMKAEQQMASLEDGDQTWTMPYRQYKDHYRDCETVAGSYNDDDKTIKVIIRAGRMKASGTRDQHYAGYEFKNQNGMLATYRAVSFENALKRAQKEFPEDTWEINHIYFYGC